MGRVGTASKKAVGKEKTRIRGGGNQRKKTGSSKDECPPKTVTNSQIHCEKILAKGGPKKSPPKFPLPKKGPITRTQDGNIKGTKKVTKKKKKKNHSRSKSGRKTFVHYGRKAFRGETAKK